MIVYYPGIRKGDGKGIKNAELQRLYSIRAGGGKIWVRAATSGQKFTK